MNSKVLLLAASSLALLSACSGAGSRNGSTAATSDTISPTEEAPAIVITALPDTAYQSAQRVKEKIDVFLPDVDSTLCTLEDPYIGAPGILLFRGNQKRDASYVGKLDTIPTDIAVDWEFKTRSSQVWGGGTGWSGQPLYIEWPDSYVQRFRKAGVVTADFRPQEIIVGSLCGDVFFIDYATGRPSRECIPGTNPIKGTGSIDPTLCGNYYIGQGVPDTTPFGAMTIDLNTGKIVHFTDRDHNAWRGWHAYDSSPVKAGQFLFRPGENGTLYKYLVEPANLKLHSTLRYRVNGAAPGMESSMVVYRNYGYVCDNHGNIICVNLNNMRPVWHYDLGDDIDGTPVLAVEGDVPYLYVGCEIDKQGEGTGNFVKLNALNGEQVWISRTSGKRADVGEKHFDGGFYCSALLGRGDCEELVFANCVLNTDGQNGQFMAFNRATGEIVYTVPTRSYSWSSPVGFLTPQGKYIVATGDSGGRIRVYDGATGKELVSKAIGNNFESSPIVIGNSMVVGTRGNSIFKLSLK